MTPAEKFQLGCEVRARGDILPRHRLIFAAALDRLNCKTGRCDPSRATLGADTSSSESTVRRALECLQEKRLIWIQSRRGRTALLHFRPPETLSTTPVTAMSGPGEGDPGHLEGQPRSFRTETPVIAMNHEPLTLEPLKGEASPSPRMGEASASLNGARQQAPSPDDRPKGIQEKVQAGMPSQDDERLASLEREITYRNKKRDELCFKVRDTGDESLLPKILEHDTKAALAKRERRKLAAGK